MAQRSQRIDSIKRALNHHGADKIEGGVVHSYSAPDPGHPSWLIRMAGVGAQNYTTAQAEAICHALAAAEAYQRHLAQIGAEV